MAGEEGGKLAAIFKGRERACKKRRGEGDWGKKERGRVRKAEEYEGVKEVGIKEKIARRGRKEVREGGGGSRSGLERWKQSVKSWRMVERRGS